MREEPDRESRSEGKRSSRLFNVTPLVYSLHPLLHRLFSHVGALA